MKASIKKWLDSLWTEELFYIENDINTWRCPDCLKRKLPITHFVMRGNQNPLCKRGIKRFFFDRHLSPIRAYIVQKVGQKEILKYHNVVRRNAMTKDSFEEWWNDNKNGTVKPYPHYYKESYINRN